MSELASTTGPGPDPSSGWNACMYFSHMGSPTHQFQNAHLVTVGGWRGAACTVHASRAMRHTALVDGCVTALGPRVPRGGLM